ncbi:LemA family protein [Oceanivirga salmonicida]|uniref:LemA family protein n=1 Tax=Oceanivirga salmonicida TaxID=1769291 RepID=UPI0008375939|nr:LemA family protein [Oceanivirga salmonicida]
MKYIIIIVLVILIFMFLLVIKNKFVTLDNINKEAWSNIKVYLQQRLDLIPNLVNTVKGYSTHEKETLTAVIEARNKLVNMDLTNLDNVEEIAKYENKLTDALRHISLLTEAYPELKADTSFLNLQEKLSEIENDILSARKYYNATCRELNIFTEKFPNSLFYGIFNFRKAKLFEANEQANTNVKVEF